MRQVAITGIAALALASGAHAAVGTGDLAIIGYNSDNPDQFKFVLLGDVGSGETVNFTDNGWFAAGGFRATEGVLSWTSGTALSAGTIVDINGGVASTGSVSSSGSFALSASGDQVIAYTGDAMNPLMIWGLHMNGSGNVWDADATSSNTSALPSGLVNGDTALAFNDPEVDNAHYTGAIRSGTPAQLRAAIADPANWTGSNTRIDPLNMDAFTVIPTPGALALLGVAGVGAVRRRRA